MSDAAQAKSKPLPAAGTVMMLCPHLKCRKILRVPEQCRGKQVKCQFCSNTFQVPSDLRSPETAE